MPLEPLPPVSANIERALVGVWRLLTREDYDSSGRRVIDPVMGADPLGLLSFSAGHFSAQFMRRDRGAGAAGPSAPAAALPGANNSAASNGYDAYFGTYTVDAGEGLVTVTLDGAITPSNIGSSFTREVRVAGNRLYIRLATNAADGVPITRTLVFERV